MSHFSQFGKWLNGDKLMQLLPLSDIKHFGRKLTFLTRKHAKEVTA